MGKKVKTKTEVDPEEELKKSLAKFKKIDPDFSTFLEDNYDIEDENSADDDDNDQQDDDVDTVHEPGPLQADSDESDFEDEDAKKIKGKVTLKMISQWQSELQDEKKVKLTTITTVIKVFNAAMLRVTTDDEEKVQSDFKVEGSGVFNAVIQMCVLYLPGAIKKYLGMDQSGKDPQKCKHFVKIKTPLIAYLSDLLTLLGGVTSTNILTVLLKHLHQICTYVACFGRISKKALKKLITLWSTGEETVRVLSFLCILRITRNQQATLLDIVLKSMYLTYVKNCKFVSPTTWPGINFMRRSLVEMFSLDLNVSYQHVFLYIRQLAIHLRNGIVVQKVENRQAIYNWQFVNSLHLWADLLGATSNKPQLQPLIYPLVMIVTNTIKLVPTHQYYPVRFHCVEILIHLSKDSDTFIPILPFLGEVLTGYDFNKKHKKVSMKPLDFSCVLRLGKSQLAENGFKDSVIENVYSLILEYLANESHRIGFPDLIVLAVMQFKEFLKKCSVSNYTKKIRQLLDKIEENSKFIERERAKVSFALSDQKMITAWETNIKNKGTPLLTFYETWNKVNKTQKRKKITKNDEIADILPSIKRVKKSSESEERAPGPVELFPSDSEDDGFGDSGEDEEQIPINKKAKPTKATKANKAKVNSKESKVSKKNVQKKKAKVTRDGDDEDMKDVEDVVEEFSANDW